MAVTDIFPPDYSTPLGQVRALIGDFTQRTDPADSRGTKEYLFEDAQLNAFLGINRGNVYYSAAHAVEVLASNEALVSKKIRTEAGVQTDGPAVANALGEVAKRLRADGARLNAEQDAEFGFEIVDFQQSFGPNDYGNFQPLGHLGHR